MNMEKVIVGRIISAFFPNGLEYLLDDNGGVKVFDSEVVAREFLISAGRTEDDICDMVFRKVIGICPHCKGPLFQSDIDGYSAQCFACDEDFYSIEFDATEEDGK